VIVPMARVRILGPHEALERTLEGLQDSGLLHPCAGGPALQPAEDEARLAVRRAGLRAVLADLDAALEALGAAAPLPAGGAPTELAPELWSERAAAARRDAEAIAASLSAARTELARLRGQEELIAAFAPVLERAPGLPLAAFQVVLRPGEEDAADRLEEALDRAVGGEFSLHGCSLSAGGLALLILVGRSAVERVESLLARAEVHESAVAREYGETLMEALPRMRARLAALPRELELLEGRRRSLARRLGPELVEARAGLADALARADAAALAGRTSRAFVLEGWVPVAVVSRLGRQLLDREDGRLVLERLSEQEWRASDAPVVLSNPRLFRPFETVTRLLPLPHYGTIDPTPFVAVFFPMFFGLMLGDVAHGAGLGLLALLFSREEALVPFLILAVSVGLVHVLLGLVLAAISALRGRRDRKAAAGAGLQAVLVVLIVLALLSALEVLPRALLTPATIVLLVLFPLFVLLEGILAPLRLLSTLSHVLSYARIMAIGTASVMLAIVANRLAGALGGALVGVVFALLFHLVNFALGIFGPALHGLRLHWVEFFGEFYSPGGVRYAPLRHGAPLGGAPGGVS
jgi:V/A-type H+-transporting ATPase subunit I